MMGAIKRFYDHSGPTVTSGGSGNAQTLTYTVAPTAYVAGDRYSFIAGFTNTGATTIDINGLGAKDVVRRIVVVGTGACAGGEIVVGQIIDIAYDGTSFQIMGPIY